jgi:hypothetical protein
VTAVDTQRRHQSPADVLWSSGDDLAVLEADFSPLLPFILHLIQSKGGMTMSKFPKVFLSFPKFSQAFLSFNMNTFTDELDDVNS